MIRRRSMRSAITPPTRPSTMNGKKPAAATIPTSVVEPPIDSTANGSTMAVIRSPMTDSAWPANSRRNWRSSRSTAGNMMSF